MFGKRWIGFAIAILLAVVVISATGGAAQRNAWMQGYMAGRLSTGADGTAALAPYMMPGSPFMPTYGGFGAGGALIGLGLLAFGFFLISRRLHYRRGWRGNREEWAARMHEEMRHWHDQGHGGPWERRPNAPEGEESQRMV